MTATELRKQLGVEPEELDRALAQYLSSPTPPLNWKLLRHPLVYAVPYIEQLNSTYNAMLEQKTRQTSDALRDRDLQAFVVLHERAYRLQAFSEFLVHTHDRIGSVKYWETLRWIWVDSENIWQCKDDWKFYLSSTRPQRHRFMSTEDRRAFGKLPDEIQVFRGAVKGLNEDGLSWTLDKERASWFARRFVRADEHPVVLSSKVHKSDVLAYLNDRNEEEVVMLTANHHVVEVIDAAD